MASYHVSAHRLLAAENLAPKLHYAGMEETPLTLYGGRYMIVMDFVDGEDWSDSPSIFSQIQYALEILHSKNLVHGDLRRPNILVKGGKAMVIDFDWCSSEGDGRYPGHLNMDSSINWHPEVKPGSLMKKKHDLFMLAELRPKLCPDAMALDHDDIPLSA